MLRILTCVTFFVLHLLFNNMQGQTYDWKTKKALGVSYSEVDSDLGTFKCKTGNIVWYCFNGEDNTYDCESTMIAFKFTNSRVAMILFFWTHNTSSAADEDYNYEKNRLTRLYGRPDMKDGVAYWLTQGAVISCGREGSKKAYLQISQGD